MNWDDMTTYERSRVIEERERSGASYGQLADQYGTTKNAVIGAVYRARTKPEYGSRERAPNAYTGGSRPKLDDIQLAQFRRMWRAGSSYKLLAKHFGLAIDTVALLRVKLGLPRRRGQRQYVDEVAAKVSSETHEQVRLAALAEGLSVSAWLRELIEERLNGAARGNTGEGPQTRAVHPSPQTRGTVLDLARSDQRQRVSG